MRPGLYIFILIAAMAPLFAAEPEVGGKAALLVDARTGRVLYAKNTDQQFAPASTIKLLTALIVWEHTGLRGNVHVRYADTLAEPSRIPLHAGEIVAVDDLVQSLLIGSNNDSALALARHVAGSKERFVALMNALARLLGCTGTVVKNPHGLPDKGQYTTAGDMLKIFEAVLAVPALREICAAPNYRLTTAAGTRTIKNHNKLLGTYPGMGPAKTGWTASSRHTYAAKATRDGRDLHLIILNSPNKWDDARALFDYGFNGAASAGTAIAKMQPTVGKNLTVYKVKKGDTLSAISRRFDVSLESIIRHNKLPNPNVISPGQILYLPL